MRPEELVPTLETCVRLKEAGWAKETYFVWMKFPTYLDGMPTGGYVYHVQQHSSHPMYPIISAPTLQELLEELPDWTSIFKQDGIYEVYESGTHKDFSFWDNHNPAEAAALLWLELHKEVVV